MLQRLFSDCFLDLVDSRDTHTHADIDPSSSLALDLPLLSLSSFPADKDLVVKPCIGVADALFVEFSCRY
jgi:hypothetical protein